MRRRFAPFAAALAALMLVGVATAVAQDGADASAEAPGVAALPPGSDPLGIPYEDWAGAWWQWFMSVPAADGLGAAADCGANQGGEAFFIPHVGSDVSHVGSCTIGADQHILTTGGANTYDTATTGCEAERRCASASRGSSSWIRRSSRGSVSPWTGWRCLISTATSSRVR